MGSAGGRFSTLMTVQKAWCGIGAVRAIAFPYQPKVFHCQHLLHNGGTIFVHLAAVSLPWGLHFWGPDPDRIGARALLCVILVAMGRCKSRALSNCYLERLLTGAAMVGVLQSAHHLSLVEGV